MAAPVHNIRSADEGVFGRRPRGGRSDQRSVDASVYAVVRFPAGGVDQLTKYTRISWPSCACISCRRSRSPSPPGVVVTLAGNVYHCEVSRCHWCIVFHSFPSLSYRSVSVRSRVKTAFLVPGRRGETRVPYDFFVGTVLPGLVTLGFATFEVFPP